MIGDIRESFGELPEWAADRVTDEIDLLVDEYRPLEDEDAEIDDEYLERLGAVEDEGEDDTAFDNLLHPNDPLEQRTGTIRRGGQRITNINADNIAVMEAQVGNEIHIRDNGGGFASISARDIIHPVIERMNEENQQLRDRVSHLETQSTRLAEVVGDMLDIMKEERRR